MPPNKEHITCVVLVSDLMETDYMSASWQIIEATEPSPLDLQLKDHLELSE